MSVADLHTKVSGARPPPPTRPNSFVFTYVFTEKCLCQRLVPPPMRVDAPQREILDPPLYVVYYRWESVEIDQIPQKLQWKSKGLMIFSLE